jgi:hypothetical protein
MKKDFLSILDVTAGELRRLVDEGLRLKKEHRAGKRNRSLEGKTLGLLFNKPSTRTRLSFQVGMTQLGGSAVQLNPSEIQLNRGETLEDTARVVSRFLDGIVIRTFAQAELEAWAAAATIPVINGLSDFSHPCQILADLLTIREVRGTLERVKVAYIGDGNNVAHSWILASGLLGLDFALAAPAGYDPDPDRWFSAADLFVLPSAHEGLGTVLLDAFHFGVPVVGSRIPGTAELLEDGVSALTFEPGDAAGLAAAIAALVRDPARRAALAAEGRRRVAAYDIEATAERYLALYRALAGARRR